LAGVALAGVALAGVALAAAGLAGVALAVAFFAGVALATAGFAAPDFGAAAFRAVVFAAVAVVDAVRVVFAVAARGAAAVRAAFDAVSAAAGADARRDRIPPVEARADPARVRGSGPSFRRRSWSCEDIHLTSVGGQDGAPGSEASKPAPEAGGSYVNMA
jgi:hypothetical protein